MKIDYDRWKNTAQSGELRFHETCRPREDGTFMEASNVYLMSLGFSNDEFTEKTILDAGAGSVLRTKFFVGSYLIAIEPLADAFMKLEWSDLEYADLLYSSPLEEYIPELFEKVDFVFSVNVLDHCYDFEACVRNLSNYLKQDGTMFLSFDSHESTDDLHPLALNDEYCRECFKINGLVIDKFSVGSPYGSGRALNYWVRKDVL